MTQLAQSSVMLLATVGMVLSMVLLVIPVAPVCLLLAVIATIAAFLTNFQPITPLALVIIWGLALVGSTAEGWLPVFGLRGKGLGCLGIVAFFLGVIVGGFLIPLPIVGTIIGAVVAVIGVQLLQVGELKAALQSGGQALKYVLLSMLAEGVFAVLILIVWFGGIIVFSR
jgi:uncharacterized protein YqgC (DUF456 family)